MPDIEPLLKPISEAQPSGVNLKYDPLYDKVREARRQEDAGPKGIWEQRDSKTSDYKTVVKLVQDALTKKTKDLQLAAWLTEAWIYEEGVSGLTSGLKLFQRLLENFWDTLYPELDEGDAEPRAATLDWVGSYFDPSKGSSPILALRNIPLTDAGYNWFVYSESRRMGYENEVSGNEARKKSRQIALEEGKIAPEVFDKDFEATKKSHFKQLEQGLKEAIEALSELDNVCRDKFADVAPSFSPLRKTLDEVSNVTHILLLNKLKTDPDPVAVAGPAAAGDEQSDGSGVSTMGIPASVAQVDLSKFTGGEIANEEQAALHVIAAAQFLRRKSPSNPVPYLLLRALRWGELRGGVDLTHADLPAPAAEVRMALRSSANAARWNQVLENAEVAMSNTCGRAWLDLQRYAVKSCDELGFGAAAKALRSELKSLLLDFPDLPKSILNDDTGTANPETMEWLRQEGLTSTE